MKRRRLSAARVSQVLSSAALSAMTGLVALQMVACRPAADSTGAQPLVGAVSVAASAGPQPRQQKGAVMTSRVLGKADSGQTVRLRVGDGLTIELPESPTTGYGWSVTERDEALVLVSNEFLAPQQLPQVVGQGGVRRLVISAGAPAAGARLDIVYMRPWEGAAAAADRFSVQVQIEP